MELVIDTTNVSIDGSRLTLQLQDFVSGKGVTMKKHVHIVLATAVLISVFAICAQAQSRNRQQLRVDVPFAFNVGNKQLPSGEYKVSIVNPSSAHSILQLQSADGKTSALVQTTDIIGWSPARAKLVFRHYNTHYFLAQVWMASEATGLATPNSSAEKSLRRQFGKAASKAALVAVNAR